MPHSQTNQRTLQYDPWADARKRHPDWRFEIKRLGDVDEVITWSEQLVELDCDYYSEDPDLAMAHVIAHLDEHRDLEGWLAAELCDHANHYALVRLDREEDRAQL